MSASCPPFRPIVETSLRGGQKPPKLRFEGKVYFLRLEIRDLCCIFMQKKWILTRQNEFIFFSISFTTIVNKLKLRTSKFQPSEIEAGGGGGGGGGGDVPLEKIEGDMSLSVSPTQPPGRGDGAKKIYFNDFCRSSDVFSYLLFAYDSNLFFSHNDPHTYSCQNIKYGITQSIIHWIRANKLSLL